MKTVEFLGKFLPRDIFLPIESRLNFDKVYEIRVRNSLPISINYDGKFFYLASSGITESASSAIIAASNLAGELLLRASQFSLYAVNSQICEGYLTILGGIRLGIAGEVVFENNSIKTIKNVSSLNIRIPHEVKNCALRAFNSMLSNSATLGVNSESVAEGANATKSALAVRNTLFISPPGMGKTTMLRDVARLLSLASPIRNILIIDERNEIAASYNGNSQLDVGVNCDVICNCKKQFAFPRGIRSLSPSVIIADEIATREDIEALEYAINCGISIITSTHAKDHFELMGKPFFSDIIKKRLFSRYIVISGRLGPGTYDGIYNADFELEYSS